MADEASRVREYLAGLRGRLRTMVGKRGTSPNVSLPVEEPFSSIRHLESHANVLGLELIYIDRRPYVKLLDIFGSPAAPAAGAGGAGGAGRRMVVLNNSSAAAAAAAAAGAGGAGSSNTAVDERLRAIFAADPSFAARAARASRAAAGEHHVALVPGFRIGPGALPPAAGRSMTSAAAGAAAAGGAGQGAAAAPAAASRIFPVRAHGVHPSRVFASLSASAPVPAAPAAAGGAGAAAGGAGARARTGTLQLPKPPGYMPFTRAEIGPARINNSPVHNELGLLLSAAPSNLHMNRRLYTNLMMRLLPSDRNIRKNLHRLPDREQCIRVYAIVNAPIPTDCYICGNKIKKYPASTIERDDKDKIIKWTYTTGKVDSPHCDHILPIAASAALIGLYDQRMEDDMDYMNALYNYVYKYSCRLCNLIKSKAVWLLWGSVANSFIPADSTIKQILRSIVDYQEGVSKNSYPSFLNMYRRYLREHINTKYVEIDKETTRIDRWVDDRLVEIKKVMAPIGEYIMSKAATVSTIEGYLELNRLRFNDPANFQTATLQGLQERLNNIKRERELTEQERELFIAVNNILFSRRPSLMPRPTVTTTGLGEGGTVPPVSEDAAINYYEKMDDALDAAKRAAARRAAARRAAEEAAGAAAGATAGPVIDPRNADAVGTGHGAGTTGSTENRGRTTTRQENTGKRHSSRSRSRSHKPKRGYGGGLVGGNSDNSEKLEELIEFKWSDVIPLFNTLSATYDKYLEKERLLQPLKLRLSQSRPLPKLSMHTSIVEPTLSNVLAEAGYSETNYSNTMRIPKNDRSVAVAAGMGGGKRRKARHTHKRRRPLHTKRRATQKRRA